MTRTLTAEPLTAAAFARFGDVIEAGGEPTVLINRGMCGRFHDLAAVDFGPGGRAGISLFRGKPYPLPLRLDMVERHPLGSQAFLPLSGDPYLVVVAEDVGGQPVRPCAFLAGPEQGVNYHRGTWHGVLTPIGRTALFAVVDRIGEGANLEEHWFETPWTVVVGAGEGATGTAG
jgi:ureidoglycolate lyase